MRRSLARETDGAIVVMGLFACAFLIGTLWYLLGVGDAYLYKERMQDGADAIAFAPSVIHARGMNIIALLNLVMAAVLAVLVAAKIVQALLVAANIAACLAWDFKDCAYLATKHKPYGNFVKKIDQTVAKINSSLYGTAGTVAKVVPVLAARRGVDAGKPYAPMVEGGFNASISLVPGNVEQSYGGSLADGVGRGSKLRFGLPVEDDDYKNLCNHAGSLRDIVFVPTLRHFPDAKQMITTILKWTGPLVEGLLRMNPNSFCGSGGSIDASALGAGAGPGQTTAQFATQVCAGMTGEAAADCNAGIETAVTNIGSPSALGTKKPVSKRIYGPARHGNDYFATWGVTSSGMIADDDRGGPGTRVARWGKGGEDFASSALDRRMREVQLAKAEFYYDPRRGGPRDWNGVSKEALWHLRWRARLRRTSQPNSGLAGLFCGPGLGAIMAGNAGSGADIGGIMSTVVCAPPEVLTQWAEQNVGPVAKTRRTGGIVH